MRLKPTADQRLARVRGRARAACDRPDYSNVRAYLPPQRIGADPPAAAVDCAATDRRRHKRVVVQSNLTVRRIGAFGFDVALQDISSGGCRVVMMEPGVAGDPVIARLPQLEPLGGRVCWSEGTVTGVQFLRTIHPAVFDMLLTRLGDETNLAA